MKTSQKCEFSVTSPRPILATTRGLTLAVSNFMKLYNEVPHDVNILRVEGTPMLSEIGAKLTIYADKSGRSEFEKIMDSRVGYFFIGTYVEDKFVLAIDDYLWNDVVENRCFSNFDGISPTKASGVRPARSPTRSPARSPSRSPARSPARSPTRSPTRSPARSPARSPQYRKKSTSNGLEMRILNKRMELEFLEDALEKHSISRGPNNMSVRDLKERHIHTEKLRNEIKRTAESLDQLNRQKYSR